MALLPEGVRRVPPTCGASVEGLALGVVVEAPAVAADSWSLLVLPKRHNLAVAGHAPQDPGRRPLRAEEAPDVLVELALHAAHGSTPGWRSETAYVSLGGMKPSHDLLSCETCDECMAILQRRWMLDVLEPSRVRVKRDVQDVMHKVPAHPAAQAAWADKVRAMILAACEELINQN